MTKVKTNFSYHSVDVGLDVHKRSWNAAVFLDGVYIRTFINLPHQRHCILFLLLTFRVLITGALMNAASSAFGYNVSLVS